MVERCHRPNRPLHARVDERRRAVAKSTRRARLILVGVVLALVAVSVPLAGPVWEWVTTKETSKLETIDGHEVLWTRAASRWDAKGPGRVVSYYTENGFKRVEGEWRHGGIFHAFTMWNFDGTVRLQQRDPDKHPRFSRQSPPWWWGVTDQTEPTAPWWKGGEKQGD